MRKFVVVSLFCALLILTACDTQTSEDNLQKLKASDKRIESKILFSFINTDNGRYVDGEVLLGNVSMGFTTMGNISVSLSKCKSLDVLFIGMGDAKKFEIEYVLPEDYCSYDIMPFELTDEEIEYYQEYYLRHKEDDFSDVPYMHFKKMPITWRIENYDECWKTEVDKIRNAFEVIENSTEKIVRFEEVFDSPDINVLCYTNMTWKLKPYMDELDTKKSCENITFNEKKEHIININEINIGQDEFIVSSDIILLSNSKTIWEICKVNKEDVSFDISIIYEDYLDILGEGGPKEVAGYIILKGEAKFIGDKDVITTCSSGFPLVEVHELLHVFGFDHIIDEKELNDKYYDSWYGYNIPENYLKDVLLPYKKCSTQVEINDYYVSCLKYIYSNGKTGKCSGVRFMYE
jgi:hypothetical protein